MGTLANNEDQECCFSSGSVLFAKIKITLSDRKNIIISKNLTVTP